MALVLSGSAFVCCQEWTLERKTLASEYKMQAQWSPCTSMWTNPPSHRSFASFYLHWWTYMQIIYREHHCCSILPFTLLLFMLVFKNLYLTLKFLAMESFIGTTRVRGQISVTLFLGRSNIPDSRNFECSCAFAQQAQPLASLANISSLLATATATRHPPSLLLVWNSNLQSKHFRTMSQSKHCSWKSL